MRILITNCQLDHRTGTETYTYDLAKDLSRLGHTPLVYSPKLGEIAFELRNKDITVVDDLDMIDKAPDVIHSHHYVETFLSSLYFPRVPVLFVCHDRLTWHSEPPVSSRILRYIAVDYNCIDRLLENSIPKEKIQVYFNAVDLKKFKTRTKPLPFKPRKALIFSNQARKTNYVTAIRRACSSLNISVDVIGQGVNASSNTPEEFLGHYDVIFAKARCALEAMACGAAVIPCDVMGCASMVSMQNVEQLRRLNFGMKSLVNKITPAFVKKQLLAYDPEEAQKVSQWIRSNASLDGLVEQYVALYHDLLKEHQEANGPELSPSQNEPNKLFKEVCRDLETYIFDAKYRIPQEFRQRTNIERLTPYRLGTKLINIIRCKLWH